MPLRVRRLVDPPIRRTALSCLGLVLFGGAFCAPVPVPPPVEPQPGLAIPAVADSLRDGATAVIAALLIDGRTGEPIEAVETTVIEPERADSSYAPALRRALSTSRGQVVLSFVPPGTYTLRTRRIGYQTHYERLTLHAGSTVERVIRLFPAATQ